MKKALITAVKAIVFFIGWAVISGIIDVPNDNPAVWRFFAELIPFAVMVVFSVIFLKIEKGEVRIPILDNGAKGLVTGSVTGVIWIGLSAAILIASHQLIITGKNDVALIWLWIVSAVINVVMQELLVRGYIYQLLKTRYNLPLAVVATTALFTLLHGGAFEAGVLPVINVITMCLFTTALYEAEGTLLAPIAAHAIWNVVGSIILGGVSLADDYPNLYSLEAVGNKLLSGGDYKIEASVIVLILNIVLMLVFYKRYKRKVS